MKLSVSRLEGFSDGLIAIIITLMVLEIPLPKTITTAELLNFGKSILIFLASFIIVGTQWNRHYHLLDKVDTVSRSFVWKNLIFLCILSLIPLFMKWVLLFQNEVVPALGYAVVYILCDFVLRLLFRSILKENKDNIKFSKNRKTKSSFLRTIIAFDFLIAIIGFSILFPEFSIICFIILTVISSLFNLFIPEKNMD